MILQPGAPCEAPPSAQSTCAFCDIAIVKTRYEGMIVIEHWDAVQRQPDVLLAMVCPNRSPQAPGVLGLHEPR
jgi:hypothetical protein